MEKGSFSLNHERFRSRGGGSTNNSDYDCNECLEAGIKHEIIEQAGPPAQGNEVSLKGDPTTIRVCTGCNKYDGPWVPAQY